MSDATVSSTGAIPPEGYGSGDRRAGGSGAGDGRPGDGRSGNGRSGDGRSGDGRTTRWDHHRTARRQDLCRAARRAVHHQGPDLSMDEMATAMGTSKSIVYRYFRDKAGLQAAVGSMVLAEMAQAFGAAAEGTGPPRQRLRAMIEVYVTMLTRSPHVYRFVTRIEQAGTISSFVTEVQRYIARLLRQVLDEAGADLAFAQPWAAGVVGFVRGLGEQWLTSDAGHRLDPDVLIDAATNWVWTGTAAPAPDFIPALPTTQED